MKRVLCMLDVVGDSDDGMIAVYTGCVDGNGKKAIAIISIRNTAGLPLTGAGEDDSLQYLQCCHCGKKINLRNMKI